MLGWAGLRGAVPIWLATLPVIAGVGASQDIFNAVFFVVVTSTLVQGATFDPLARRLGLTTDEPAVPQPIVETGTVGASAATPSPTSSGPTTPRSARSSATSACRARRSST